MSTEKSTVAIVRTTPETVLEDYARLMDLINYDQILDKSKTTILKNNISCDFPSSGVILKNSRRIGNCGMRYNRIIWWVFSRQQLPNENL